MRPRNVFYDLGSPGFWHVKGVGFVPDSSIWGPEPDPRVVAAFSRHGASSNRGYRTVHRALKAMAHLALIPGATPWMVKEFRRGRGREFRYVVVVPGPPSGTAERVREWAVAYLQGRA